MKSNYANKIIKEALDTISVSFDSYNELKGIELEVGDCESTQLTKLFNVIKLVRDDVVVYIELSEDSTESVWVYTHVLGTNYTRLQSHYGIDNISTLKLSSSIINDVIKFLYRIYIV